MPHFDVVIVGTGHAGAQAAVALRQNRFTGAILMIGAEPELPYERPPLSKDYLAGDKPFDDFLIRSADFWHDAAITFRRGRRAVRVEAAAKQVELEDGEIVTYGTLIWAAGGRARRLACPGADLAGLHTIRTRADVDRLRTELAAADRVAVIGGGYIGLEAAAVMVTAGKQVTVLEAQDRLLARVAGEPLSRFYEAEHRAQGVDLHLGVSVRRLRGRDGQVEAVCLEDGTEIAAPIVVVGIGIVPDIEPLREAGAGVENGLTVNGLCQTSLPDVYAIGDCAHQPRSWAEGAGLRIESVQNAVEQATIVARHLTGGAIPAAGIPSFWSNQYDLRLQTIGLSLGHDRTVLRGNPADRSFSVIYLREERVIALDCVNAMRDFAQGRALVAKRAAILPQRLADQTIPLKEMLA